MRADEHVLDTATVRGFVAEVRAAVAGAGSPPEACAAIRPAFERLLRDDAWLPDEYAAPAPESGMGGGIGQWLLFRAGDGSLSLFSLVVPPGSETPVHDHLAWGLVGLYRGTQDEEIFVERNGGLALVERRALEAGDLYSLLPPRDDIHRVRTTSAETSVSIHLLTNDTGCVWRHAFDPETGEQRPFRSGYVNVDCSDDDRAEAQLEAAGELFRLLEAEGIEYRLFGGWAVDFHAGRVTRAHDDVDIAVWQEDAERAAALLAGAGWLHAPEADEDGGTGYARGVVRLELTWLVRHPGDGRVCVALRDGPVPFAGGRIDGVVLDLGGVRAHVLAVSGLIRTKMSLRDSPEEQRKDAVDRAELRRLDA